MQSFQLWLRLIRFTDLISKSVILKLSLPMDKYPWTAIFAHKPVFRAPPTQPWPCPRTHQCAPRPPSPSRCQRTMWAGRWAGRWTRGHRTGQDQQVLKHNQHNSKYWDQGCAEKHNTSFSCASLACFRRCTSFSAQPWHFSFKTGPEVSDHLSWQT